MNYLAHAYLSFNDPEILAGNLISDFVKGKKKFDYQTRIREGIDFHRAIDAFTDQHTVTKGAARLFRPAYGLYSLAFMDVVYDHFLAIELAAKGEEHFMHYTLEVYKILSRFEPVLPETFRSIFPYMRQYNWLYNYQYNWGIEKSFQGLVHRAAYLTDSSPAFTIFLNNYETLRLAYGSFFPQLMKFSLEKFSDIH